MANVYAKKPITISHGSGAVVYDAAGREYIDCAGGYGTCIVGHAHPKVVSAIAEQAKRLIACHGSTYNETRSQLLQRISQIAPKGLERAYLGNSGAEAIELAIKLSRKFTGRREVVAMMGAFHGKTLGALSATWDKKYRQAFEPLQPEFVHVPFGNLEKAKEAVTKRTAAVLVEPVQGEGGIKPPPDDYLRGLRDLASDNGALLAMDEVQTGFGRTGKLFACEHWKAIPDILCFAKGVASGLPIGITLARDDVMACLKVGEHTSTYGGNPVASAAASATIDVLLGERLVENAADVGNYLKAKLTALRGSHNIVRDVRGLGLMLAFESRFDVLNVLLSSLEMGVLMLDAGRNVVRFLPPLVLNKRQVDRVATVLDSVLQRDENERLPAKASH